MMAVTGWCLRRDQYVGRRELRQGAVGLIHDWTISRRIAELVGTPVILAGGLGPDNVADAIRAVCTRKTRLYWAIIVVQMSAQIGAF